MSSKNSSLVNNRAFMRHFEQSKLVAKQQMNCLIDGIYAKELISLDQWCHNSKKSQEVNENVIINDNQLVLEGEEEDQNDGRQLNSEQQSTESVQFDVDNRDNHDDQMSVSSNNQNHHKSSVDQHKNEDRNEVESSSSSEEPADDDDSNSTSFPDQSRNTAKHCPHCPKSFNRQWRLNQHLQTHTAERPIQCKRCGRRFVRPCDLKIHSIVHEVEGRPVVCGHCKNRFKTAQDVKKHHIRGCIRLLPSISKAMTFD